MDNFTPIRREKSYPRCGRIIVLEEGTTADHLSPLDLSKFFSIDFPAMPDQIELARMAEYKVLANMVVPDGVHQYMRTQPLEIPFEFKLHFLDKEYCKDGALSILNIAARLHSLVVPLGNSELQISVTNDAALNGDGTINPGGESPGTAPNKTAKAGKAGPQGIDQQAMTDSVASIQTDSTSKVDPPVTCRLELLYTTPDGPGIVCNGYVKNVKAILLQPWLRGPNGAFNLPSAGIYSFTFVHRPGHGNWYSNRAGVAAISQQAQAYADLIRNRLYNTRTLQTDAQYRGFFTRTTS